MSVARRKQETSVNPTIEANEAVLTTLFAQYRSLFGHDVGPVFYGLPEHILCRAISSYTLRLPTLYVLVLANRIASPLTSVLRRSLTPDLLIAWAVFAHFNTVGSQASSKQ